MTVIVKHVSYVPHQQTEIIHKNVTRCEINSNWIIISGEHETVTYMPKNVVFIREIREDHH